MSVEKWKWRSSSGLALGQPAAQQYDSEKAFVSEQSEGKTPRVLTRALRSLSSSSMDSITANSIRSSSSTRRLQKTPSNSGSMIGRLHRRVSKDSGSHGSPSDAPGSPVEGPQPYSTMAVLHYGPLRADISLLKARAEYLVLSDQSLVKFTSIDAARASFTQLQSKTHARDAASSSTAKVASGDVRLEIPLRSIVASFNEDSVSHRFGIEIWWFSQWPRLAYCKAHLHFELAKERDEWLAAIHHAYRAKIRKSPAGTLIPENLKTRIDHIVRSTEGIDDHHQNIIFPIARRALGQAQKASSADEAHDSIDSSSFFLVIGPCMCHFVEALKADHSTMPGDLRVKAVSYGTVTLTRFKASVASHQQRFIMCFRAPFCREIRLDLASVQYRRIIEALITADRNLKPMWPQALQHTIFDVKGLPPPLQLTKGNDLGGLESSLRAYCAAYQVQVPTWKIEWNTPPNPAFRLLPPEGPAYSPLQLLAVFRSLRYNSFFKAVSFRDVDLSSLTGRYDYTQYGDGVACRSLSSMIISEDHHDALLQATVLEQEIHAVTFTSESIRSIDLANCLGLQHGSQRLSRLQRDLDGLCKKSSEFLRPILTLWRQQMCVCQSVILSGNPIAFGELDELANMLGLDYAHIKKLHLSKCALGDAGLSRLWTALAGQAFSLECLDTSDNQGIVRFDIIRGTLSLLQRVVSLNIAGNTRILSDEPLLDADVMANWLLRDLDLSGIMLNDATVDVLAAYLGSPNSHGLQLLRLNHCGLTARQISRLFRTMGQARRLTAHVSGNRLDDGIDDLCSAVACGFGPWSLFLQMVEFTSEDDYIKLLRALTVNKTIECLSLAGTATVDSASSVACQAVADFFSKNDAVRFLDISGYDSKLDEGRLGREFSKALSGMRSNTRIEHLRVRSQMLNINIGDLAEAISGNKALHTLDCEGNDFNLSNFRHLIRHLGENMTIRHFSAFSDQELSRAIRKSVQSAGTAAPIARRSSVISRFRTDKTQSVPVKPLIQQLRDEWDTAVADLELVLERNQQMMVARGGFYEETAAPPSRRHSDVEGAFSTAFGGLARREFESQRPKGSQESASQQRRATSTSTHSTASEFIGQGIARPVSTVSSEAPASPTTDGASSGGTPSPPDLESPADAGFSLVDVQNALATFGAFGDERDGNNSGNGGGAGGGSSNKGSQSNITNYTYSEAQDAEGGVQMKRYRRYWGSTTARIDEEDGGICDGADRESA